MPSDTLQQGDTTVDYTPLHQAAQALAGVCDWASNDDGKGYNKPDAWFGHAAAATPVEDWDDAMALTMWAMVRKYRKQLNGHGIDYDTLPVPPGADELDTDVREEYRQKARNRVAVLRDIERLKSESWVRCDGEGERVAISFPYNPALVAELKGWPRSDGRHYNWPGDARNVFPDKSNDFPFETLPKVIEFADRHGIPVPGEVRALVESAAAHAAETVLRPAEVAPNVTLDDKGLVIRADYDPALNQALKDLNSGYSTWDRDANVHRPPSTDPDRLKAIIDQFGLIVDPAAQKMLDGETERQTRNRIEAKLTHAEGVPVPGLADGITIKPVQWPAIHWAVKHSKAILGDAMGFGKTIQALAAIAIRGAYPAVVVCRPSLVLNWAEEIERFFPWLNVWIAESQTPTAPPPETDIVIIGTAALGYTPPVPAWEVQDRVKAKAEPLGLVDAAKARKAAAYLLAKFTTALRVANALDSAVVSKETVERLTSGEQDKVQRQVEEILVRGAILESQTGGKPFPWLSTLKMLAPKAVIHDEGQDGKESTANRSQAIEALCKGAEMVLNLSGTSILNRPLELLQQLTSMGLIHLFSGPKAFKWRYCVDPSEKAKHHDYGPKYTGRDNMDELHDRLCAWGIMVRRTDPDLLGLPKLTQHTLRLGPPDLNRAVMVKYRKAETDVIEFLGAEAMKIAKKLGVKPDDARVKATMRARSAEHFVLLNTLRKLVAEAKRDYITAWIADRVAEGEKIMVAAHHRPEVTHYAKKFGGLKIQGGQSAKAVQADKKRFQTEPVSSAPVISVSIDAGGVGHTLTAARIGIQAEWPWGPGVRDQMMKRIHRIGQARECHYYLTVAENTIDEEMEQRVAYKKQTLDAVLDGVPIPDGVQLESSEEAEMSVAAEIAWAYAMRGTGGRA